MAYTSKVNIRLGEVPKTTDGEIFADLVDIYNAIHILAQYVNQLAGQGNPDEDTLVWDSIPWKNSFWYPAKQNIKAGEVVCFQTDGMYKGCTWEVVQKITGSSGAHTGPLSQANAFAASGGLAALWGIALSDAAPGKKVRVGVGPATIKLTGCKAGDFVYGVGTRDANSPFMYGFSAFETPAVAPVIEGVGPISSVPGGSFWAAGGMEYVVTGINKNDLSKRYRFSNDGGMYLNVASSAPHTNQATWDRGYFIIGMGIGTDAALIFGPEGIKGRYRKFTPGGAYGVPRREPLRAFSGRSIEYAPRP